MKKAASLFSPEEWDKWGWIVKSVSKRHGVPVARLLGRDRFPSVSRARQDLMACLHGSGLSYPEIGRLLGRDHTTVLYGVRRAVG